MASATAGQVVDELGPVDILVNNAGITRDNIFIRMKEGEWDEVLTVNLKGAFNMTKSVARSMMKRRSGVILNVTSVVGLVGNAGQANYAASKAGLIGFTKSIAKELASRGVRCNAIAPGFISTDMTATLPEEAVEALHEQIPLGFFGDPGDIAGLARFLAGPAGRYITGQVIAVDGGMAM
jgi:3-oxoacyl-[acyl-carrier protein] reductase